MDNHIPQISPHPLLTLSFLFSLELLVFCTFLCLFCISPFSSSFSFLIPLSFLLLFIPLFLFIVFSPTPPLTGTSVSSLPLFSFLYSLFSIVAVFKWKGEGEGERKRGWFQSEHRTSSYLQLDLAIRTFSNLHKLTYINK